MFKCLQDVILEFLLYVKKNKSKATWKNLMDESQE